jgi:hypothetical protein
VSSRALVERWREFATVTMVEHGGERRSWARHLDRRQGYSDEEGLVQPVVFPKFAKTFLEFEVGTNLAAERASAEGKPDFTPADALSHPFVFETKSTRESDFTTHLEQVSRYLTVGQPRIHQVVVTNMATIEVYALDGHGRAKRDERYTVDLRYLLAGTVDEVAGTGNARRFAALCADFSYRSLDSEAKLGAVREQQDWNPDLEATSSDWTSRRIDAVVERLTRDVADQVADGAVSRLDFARRQQVLVELRDLEWRLGSDENDIEERSLDDYLHAREGSNQHLALRQYVSHTAYFATTRLLVVRIWEDLDLVEPVLYDGGFDQWMTTFSDVINRVVSYSFDTAAERYPTLYGRAMANNYTWFVPARDTYADVIYDLANTYFGEVTSDVLGTVYERMLERIDRKKVGQFYTPRDIIRLMWDLVDLDALTHESEQAARSVRAFDIATGSGGFLVELARRLRERVTAASAAGAAISIDEALEQIAEGLVGVEIQRFSAYLAEVNLLVQFGYLLAQEPEATLPTLGILCNDAMALHEPDRRRLEVDGGEGPTEGITGPEPAKADIHTRIKSVGDSGFEVDVAIGNPPYVGEKTAAQTLARTRNRYPYWEQFAGARLDLLYWFIILGVSKLRLDGRFAFITSEYWLRSEGARRTREYIARRCHIDRLLLFRKLRLFPDAPGHDSLVIVGRRVAPADHLLGERAGEQAWPSAHRPRVSIYQGANLRAGQRNAVLKVMRDGRSARQVKSFTAPTSPNELGGEPWHEVVLTPTQVRRRRELQRRAEPLRIDIHEGVIATPVRLRAAHRSLLPQRTLQELDAAGIQGIFVLRPGEVEGLGSLNDLERSTLRPQVEDVRVAVELR